MKKISQCAVLQYLTQMEFFKHARHQALPAGISVMLRETTGVAGSAYDTVAIDFFFQALFSSLITFDGLCTGRCLQMFDDINLPDEVKTLTHVTTLEIVACKPEDVLALTRIFPCLTHLRIVLNSESLCVIRGRWNKLKVLQLCGEFHNDHLSELFFGMSLKEVDESFIHSGNVQTTMEELE